MHANLRKAPKLTTKVLHSGNCKHNVPHALAIFNETTISDMKSYFLEKASAVAFLTLFSKWWVLSNSKARYSTSNYLGYAAVIGDNKQTIILTRNGRLVSELTRKGNSKLREVYSDLTNRFSIGEYIKMPWFAYRRFACGGIQFHHDIQISG